MSSCKTKDSLYREQSRQMWFLLSLLNIILCQRKFFSISKCFLWHKLPPLLASAKVHVWDFSKKYHKTQKLWRRVNWKSSMVGILIHILWLKFWIIVSAQGIFPFQHLKSSENNYIITPSSKKKKRLLTEQLQGRPNLKLKIPMTNEEFQRYRPFTLRE